MTSSSHPVNFVRLLLLSLSVALAALVGTLPVSSYLQTRLLPYFLAAEAVIFVGGYLYSRRDQKPVSEGGGGLEYLLRALSAISLWGFLGVITLFVYKGLEVLFRLLGSLIHWFDNSLAFDATTIAFYVTFGFALIFGVGIATAVGQSIATRIYSVSLSSRNVEYSKTLGEQNKIYLYVSLTVIALGVMVALLLRFGGNAGFWFHLMLQAIPYVGSAWLLKVGTRVHTDSEIVEGIGRLLQVLGYEVVFSPKTTDSTLQTLLTGIDILATKGNNAHVIQVKTLSSSASSVDWTAASGLRMKALALHVPDLAEKLEGLSLANKKVDALLIICGRKLDPSLIRFSSDQTFDIVTLDNEATNRLPSLRSENEIVAFAEEYFPKLAGSTAISSAHSNEHTVQKEGQWA